MAGAKCYHEAIQIQDYLQRFRYLKTKTAMIGDMTFGGHRSLNQTLYQSPEWRKIRRQVIIRDDGCDLAHPDHPIGGRIVIHHIDPITIEDILERSYKVFDMDNLITVDFNTHEALHFGDENLLPKGYVERTPNDTCPWK